MSVEKSYGERIADHQEQLRRDHIRLYSDRIRIKAESLLDAMRDLDGITARAPKEIAVAAKRQAKAELERAGQFDVARLIEEVS